MVELEVGSGEVTRCCLGTGDSLNSRSRSAESEVVGVKRASPSVVVNVLEVYWQYLVSSHRLHRLHFG